MTDLQDRIRGSLIGGAVGDALGYAVEFIGERSIFAQYGEGGIQEYELNRRSKKAVISDDTQMTLFTAQAMIFGAQRNRLTGENVDFRHYIAMGYLDWLITQNIGYDIAKKNYKLDAPDYPDGIITTPLMNIPELYVPRAPGLTCLGALRTRGEQRRNKVKIDSFIEKKVNNSKGCGGVMRVAPVGLYKWADIEAIDMESAEAAAVTHSNSLGYMPAAVLAHVVNRVLYNESGMTLKEIVLDSAETLKKIFADDANVDIMVGLIERAVELSENSGSDLDNIHRLGEGWVGDEALAIALYCCLRYPDDFSKAIIVSVNHKGDSDSTGAIAGNILGAVCGYEAMEQKWKDNLELRDEILELADNFYNEMSQTYGK